MTGLHMLYLLTSIGMIYAIGCWHYHECRRRRAAELDAALDRRDIREVAEAAASDAASCVAVIDRIGPPEPAKSRRPMHLVREHQAAVSNWNWE